MAAELTGAHSASNLSQNETSFFHLVMVVAPEADSVFLELEAL